MTNQIIWNAQNIIKHQRVLDEMLITLKKISDIRINQATLKVEEETNEY